MLFGWVSFLGKLDYVLTGLPFPASMYPWKGKFKRGVQHLFCKPSEQDGKTSNKLKTSFVAASL